MWGETGITRLFSAEMGGQIAWLLPAALILLGYLLWMARRAPRTDGRRAQVLLWGTWLVVTGLLLQLRAGDHPPLLHGRPRPGDRRPRRHRRLDGVALPRPTGVPRSSSPRVVIVTAVWSYALLDRSPDWLPWLRPLVLLGGFLAAVGFILPFSGLPFARRAMVGAAGLAVVTGLAGPAAYAVDTAVDAAHRLDPLRGPGGRRRLRARRWRASGGFRQRFGQPGGQGFAGRRASTGGARVSAARASAAVARAGSAGCSTPPTPDSALVQLLRQDTTSTWAAAAVGSNSAAGVQLATGRPVMAIGGFNGSDPSPTLAQFQADVAAGKIHYFLASGGGGFGGGFGGGPGRRRLRCGEPDHELGREHLHQHDGRWRDGLRPGAAGVRQRVHVVRLVDDLIRPDRHPERSLRDGSGGIVSDAVH